MSDTSGEKFVVTEHYAEDEQGNMLSREVEYESEEAWLDSLDPWEQSGVSGDKSKNELWCTKCYALLLPWAGAAHAHQGWHEELERRMRRGR